MNTIVLPDEIVSKIMLYNSHPAADMMKDRFKDDATWVSKFVYLRYYEGVPLIKCGSNGRQIHRDYDEYWEEFQECLLFIIEEESYDESDDESDDDESDDESAAVSVAVSVAIN